MKLSEAIKALEDGKKVRNVSWNESDYIYIKDKVLFGEDNQAASLEITGFSDDWEIYKDPVKMYSFTEMLPFFLDNKMVRRKHWTSWYQLEHGFVYKFIFSQEDFAATDWIVKD